MASRRQKQFDRKYSSYRKYTATEDVNYSTHSSRSSYRSESLQSRNDGRGRSTSSEIISGSETRSYPVYIAIQDYQPDASDVDAIGLEQGQIVEVLDNKNMARWLVRTKARPPQSGWVPGSYFETPTEYYKQRRRTREIDGTETMTEEQQATLKRDQVYHDLLNSEEEFVANLRSCVDFYINALEGNDLPAEVASARERLALNVHEIYNFHANVLLKGLNYYSDDPAKVGQTFVRLERDFEQHVHFFRELPETLKLLEEPKIREYFEARANTCEAGASSFPERLQMVADRMTQYQNFFKEFVKYASRAQTSSKSVQKALELVMGVPERVHELEFTRNITEYPGDTTRLGKLVRHDLFKVDDGEGPKDRYVFMFKNKLMITERSPEAPYTYRHCATIRLDKYSVRTHTSDPDTLVLKSADPGLPAFSMTPSDLEQSEYIRKAWLKDIAEEHEAYAAERAETETTEGETLALGGSDLRSEFSEYTATSSRKSSLPGPEEGGPPRKKIKSPPVISPTGSTTSIYSGGSSSIDWTTTGTTLEMQGTRVTRTQYGFRTLQESSAKMCLKVTGYPLPDITWYKDDVQLHEDERHTFYADEDGFFAMTIDPVQVEDTGRYTCMATNEYGQASTSAFFRVLKVEKEAAPPKFVNSLKDQECKEGEVCSFECEVEGWPEPELVWLVDDQPLRPSHDFRLQYDGQTAKLEIRDAQPDDTGVYTVKIQNEFGEAQSRAELMVLPDPDKNHVAPEFQAVIEDVECREGDEVRFKAVVTGDPNPDITWLINGYPLSESEKVKFISEDGICILTIKDVTRHFDGIVTCQATNRLGTEQCTGRLRVIVPPAPPTFNKPLEDKTVVEKNNAVFEVDVAGWPEPSVVFTLKGKELKHGEDGVEISGADGYFRVVINNCSQETHEGEIVARATNEHGTAESRARLMVEQPEEESRSAPTFLKDIEDQTVKHGEPAVFETTVSGSPNPEVTWYINGHKMDPSSPGVKIEFVNHDHKLTVDSAHYAGTVLCRAENAVGRFETKARLVVLPQEKQKKSPRFVETLQDVTETEQNTVVFEVRVEGEPIPTVKWFLNGVELTVSERVEIREFDGSVKLELKNISMTNAGEIKCVATNSEGTAESSSKLIVKRKPFAPSFDKSPQSITVEKGEKAEFCAHAEAEPAPEYQWSVDGRKIRESTEGASVRLENGVSILTLDTKIFSQSSTIVVTAENSHGMDETGARLTVSEEAEKRRKEEEERLKREEEERKKAEEEARRKAEEEEAARKRAQEEEEAARKKAEEDDAAKKRADEEAARKKAEEEEAARKKAEEDEAARRKAEKDAKKAQEEETMQKKEDQTTETEQKRDSAAPKVTSELKTQTVSRGDLAHFEAVIEHATTVRWYHKEKEVTSSTHGVKISQDEHFEFRLSLDSSVFSEGEVSIVGENSLGSASSKCELKLVEQMREFKKPEFTDKLKDMELFREEAFQMDVIALNSPQYKWYINGKELKNGVDGVTIVEEGNKSSLRIEKALPEHEGANVKVTATNEVGTSECTAKLTLKDKTTAPVIHDELKDTKTKEGEAVEYKVKITGFPEPRVQWYVNEKIVEHSETTIVSHTADEYSLRLTETKITESGTVRVTAENQAGSDRKESKLVIEVSVVAPVFSTRLEETTVTEGETHKWEVKFGDAAPGTTVKWYINGKEITAKEGVEIIDKGDGTHQLSARASPELDGTLTVKATNVAGESESSAKITVRSSQRKPEFTKTPQNHETTIQESVKFSAVVEGNPTPQVSWFLNGQKLEHSEAVKVKHDTETGKTSIRVHKPQVSDSGEVKVVAENSIGKVEATAQLKVDRKTEVPKFTTNMDDRQVNEGDSVKYTSTVEGYPAPTVEWTLNGEPVSKHPNIKVSDDGNQHTIEITDIKVDQAGELSCQANNAVGLKKQNVQLAVKIVGEAPTFAKNLEDRLVTEGELTLMEAKLNQVKPKPKITWLKDGKEFSADDHWKLEEQEDGTLKLQITVTDMADKSRITIKAENHFGAAECSASLGVVKKSPMAKPAFQSDIAPISLNEGDSLQTKVLITGNPTPFVKWYINGQLVCETEDTEITNANGVYSLTIHGVSHDMTGKIKCTAYNKAGEVSTEGQLKVTKPIPVEFETSLCDATCREGDTLKLKAVLLGEPTPVVSWYVNGKKLEETQNIKIHAEKGTYTVTIKDITCDYSGKVVCEAVNEYGKASSEAMLLVLPRGEPPDFLEWLSNVRARQGSKVVHKVVFTGDPKPVLTWYINNQEITAGGDITIVTDDKTSILTINNFNPEKHVGEIICKAENDAGEVSCTANMATYTSDMFSESESEAQMEEFGAEEAGATDEESLREEVMRTPTPVMAPKFITKIKDAKAKKGHEAIFECVVPDTKGVVCKWLKDGKEVELIARIRVQTRTGPEGLITQELIIEDVQPEDVGKYTVVVENSAGRDVCEATLTIVETIEKPSDKAPEFTANLQDRHVQTSDKVVFECKVVGEPKPSVSWFHEQVRIEESSTVKIETSEDIQRLVISSAELRDEGKYTCVAENTAGTSRTEAVLQVKVELPEFTKRLQDIQLSVGEKLIFSCSVKGQPQPHVEFFRESTRLTSSERISVEHDKTNTHWRMVINQVTREELNMVYKAVATNTAGSVTSEAKASEKQTAPVFEQGLKKTSVKEKEEIRMEVKVAGTAPEVEFLKDGEPVKEDSNHQISKDVEKGSFTLVIKESALSDAGKYTAKATNAAGTAESSAETEVEKALEKPSFVKELASIEIKEKTSTTLSVTVKGVPSPDVEFLKDGEPVKEDSNHQITKNLETGSFTLVIKDSTLSDAGKYTAKATNVAGTAESTAEITLTQEMQKPSFVKELTSVEMKEKTTTTLSVTVKGVPSPTVEFFKDGEPVKEDSTHEITKSVETGNFTLIIKESSTSDAGKYTAKATNSAGTAESTAEVTLTQEMQKPSFVKELVSIELKEKSSSTLSVTVKGVPAPEVEWQRDGKPVEIDGSHLVAKKESGGEFTLTVKDARKEDAGHYTAKAVNKAGEATSECDVKIAKAGETPRFTEELRPLEVKETETLRLSVTVEGEPVPTISWQKDGRPIEVDGIHLVAKDEGHGHFTLTVNNARTEDVGVYSCTATNEAGSAKTEAKMGVLEDVEAPHFVEGLKPLETEEGKPVELSVTVEGKPEPQVAFLKDGVPVNMDNEHEIKKDSEGHHVLVIKKVSASDEGKYSCVAQNKAGQEVSIGELKVPRYSFEKTKEEELAPFFVEPLKEATALVGETVALECRVNAESKPEIKWFKEGRPVTPGPHMETTVSDDGLVRLVIHGATAEDIGSYRCEAINNVGSAQTTAQLKYPEQKTTTEAVEMIEELAEMKTEDMAERATATTAPTRGAPEFIELLRSCTVAETQMAVLKCRVSGEPRPKIRWTKDGKVVEMSARVRSEHKDDGTVTLTIDQTSPKDAGEYRCEAENELGSAWTEAPIILTQLGAEPAEGDAPDFIQPVRPAVVEEGETAVLEGKISGKPTPTVKWYKNGEQLKPSERVQIESLADGTQRLTVKDAKLSDMDEYRCEASNEYGDVWSDVTLTVKEKHMEAPEFVKELNAVSVTEGKKAEFECKVTGLPKPEVKWFKDGEELKEDARLHKESSADGTEKLIIETAKVEDQGNYRVEVTNPAGQSNSKAPLSVTPSDTLKIKRGLEDQKVTRGMKIQLTVEVEGKPKTVKWYRDNQQVSSSSTTKIEQVTDHDYKLEIASSETTDAGSYRVVLSTESVSVESSCTVTVSEGTPIFKKGLSDQKVPKGTALVLEVEVEGKPKAVKWFKGNNEIPGEDLGNGKYRLSVPDFKEEDIGQYRVEAENESGKVDSCARVDLGDDGKDKNRPEIVSGLVPTTVAQGETATFTVKTKGPVKGVKWYKNGKEITGKTSSPEEGVFCLEVPNAQKDDTADYKVVVSNDAGEADSAAALTVKLPKLEIDKGLEDQAVPKGQDAVLEVKTLGKPKEVKWYKNGKEISPSDKAKPEKAGDDTFRLKVPKMDDGDVADYKVVLVDDDGNTADSACALTVKLPRLEITKGLEDQAVEKGKKAVLEVKTNGKPKQVKWYKNGKEIGASDKAKPESEGDNTYKLVIPDAGEDDAAEYNVVLTGEDGTPADSSCALTVKLPRLEITKGLEDQTVEKGKKAILEVKTNAKPRQVKWYKNGKELGGGDKPIAESYDDNTHRLVIPDAEDDDAADYKVVLTGEDGTPADSFCALTVKLPAEEPRFVKGLEDQTVPVGAPLVLEIKTTGSPKTVRWYRNGRELAHAAGKVNIKKIDDNNYVLEIPKASVDDTGDFKVEIENEAGKAQSQGKITVEPQLTFLKGLKDQEVVEGENAEFKVETNAKPKTVKWYKNGQEIKPDAHFVLGGDDKTYSLTIKGATKEDAAQFKVVLSNSAGDTESSAKLTVKKPKPGAPRIVKGLDDQVVAKGASLVFEVKIEGEVDEVRWLKDASPVGANAVIEKIDDKTYRLTIPKADLSDGGQYVVEAINEGGKAKSDAKGEVDEKPEIVKGLEDVAIEEGDDDVFKVEVSAPVRTVKWYKNGQEIKPSNHMEPKKIGPKKYELAINKAQLDDGATYKVVLVNAAGDCDSEAALTVTRPNILKLLEGLKDIDVDEGQPLELKVKVQGTPKSVKWYKNGQELAPSDRLKMKENPESGEFSLEIPVTEKQDGAAYRVVLTNDKGEVYSGCVAHVKAVRLSSKDIGANMLTPLKDTEVEEGETLTLTCKVGGEPFPEIKWEKDGVLLEKSDRISMRVALDGTVTLRVRDAKKSDLGQYRVTATNSAGSEASACAVTVKDKGEEPSKPHFVIPLSSCSAAIGEKKEFSVKVRGFPKPTLKWTLNGETIKKDDHFVIEDIGAGNYSLTIKDIRESDFGTLRCVATNDLGSDECSCEFEKSTERPGREATDDRYPPRFNVPLWDRRIPAGDPLSIECHVDAKPTAEIFWYKDGQPLNISSRVEIRNTSDGACRVRIANYGPEDCGNYLCVAKNELGQADTRAIYSIEITQQVEEEKKAVFAPKFNPGLEDKTVNAKQSLRISCSVTAEPRASVVWYKDGLPLRADVRISLEYSEDGECSLNISEAKESDEGAYRCVATNEHGATNTSCLVTVKTPKAETKKEGEEPFFTKNLVDVWTDRGDEFTLKCAAKGDPFPEIKWYRNGQLVRNSPRCVIDNKEDGSCSLIVKECTMSDEGIYRCEAENKIGKAKTQATAHVQMALSKSDKPKVEEGQPPRFITPLEDMTVTVGSIIDLECKVTGQPMPQVKWSKDGGPIWEDVRYDWDIDEAKGTYHLRIKTSAIADEGTYRCVATNESGSATTKAFVRIDDGLTTAAPVGKALPPRFTIKLGDGRATEGQPLKMECKVEGFPLPDLTWHKDGAQIQPSDRVQISLGPDGVARLLIPQCNMDDDGIYRVIATNHSGSAHDKGTATVKRAPRDTVRASQEREPFDTNKAPKLLEPLENVKVPEKEGFRLRCKWSGDPRPTVKWFKDGERVFPYGRLQLIESEDGVCELVVSSSTRHDAGGYRCVAENSYGSARTTCEVTVIMKERKPRDIGAALSMGKAPGFTIPLTIRRAKEGDTVVFDCLPYGTPFPNIKWLKDGIELVPGDKCTMEALPDGTQKLTIKDCDFLSEGYYRCVATNEHGTASTKAELTVEGDRSRASKIPLEDLNKEPEESKPRIRRGLYNMSIHQGNVVEMIVCATGWPTPTVKWFKDGEEIISEGPDGRRVVFTDERGIHHLVILNSGPEDEGEYSLEATNKLGSARTEGALNIIRPRMVGGEDYDDRGGLPFPPGFVRQLKNKHVFNHMPTIFDCLVVGHPAPEVEWFHNGKKITPGGRVKIQSCGGGSHAIIIMDTTLEDAGEYVAVAKNSHGTASSSAILDVTVPFLDNIKFNGEIDVSQYLTEEYGFKKINVASLPTPPDRGPFIKEVTGHYLTLSWIPTKRAPPRYPQVSYVIEIRELPEKEWTLLDYNIPEPVCKVRNLELGKSYQFRVRAENIYGISDPSPASPPSRLMAPPQPVLDKRTRKVIPLLDPYAERALDLAHAEQYACAPWFAPGVVEKRFCAENDTLTLILNVSGYPDPTIQWKFRGWDVDTKSPTSKCKVYTYGGTETTLTIVGFSKENVGQYQCVATNAYGEAQQNIMVDLATRPSFIQPLMNKTFSSAHPMRLDVRVEGQPFPELKWMKEWRPIVESSRVKFVQDGPYLCSLIINDPMWRDSGIYSCVAVNDAGQATTSCSVTVEADGDYNDVELPKKRVAVEARKVREIYEIEEEDEKAAASGAPFRVKEKKTGERFLAQLKPYDEAKKGLETYNALEHGNTAVYRHVLSDKGDLAVVVYEDVTGTILENLLHPGVAVAEPTGQDREKMVQIFMRQLLLALEQLHGLRIAHLDLRPEAILMQDGKLKLADFGQSRRLLRGLITGIIRGSPEFVSPEIVRGYPLTLATDLWSVGTLAYVLLTGVSPFHGDNDEETLANVDKAEVSFDGPEWDPFSDDAKSFVANLLKEIPAYRMTCGEALEHRWISDEDVKKAQLPADGLREFNYTHKWLERRVFVQQTPSEQLLEAILAPSTAIAKPQPQPPAEGAGALEHYDHLRIKQRPPPSVEDLPRRKRKPLAPVPEQPQDLSQYFLPDYFPPGAVPPPPQYSQKAPRRPDLPPGHPGHSRGEPQREKIPLDQFGRLIRQEDLARIPHDSFGRPLDLEQKLPQEDPRGQIDPRDPRRQQQDPRGVDPRRQQPQDPRAVTDPRRGPPPEYSMTEKRKLIPQEKGETPSKTRKDAQRPSSRGSDSEEDMIQVPLRMIRGERRQIEEEIANRILSDISEEGSVAGSLASIDEIEPLVYEPRFKQHSPSATPKAESDASTPTPSPVNTIKEGNFFPDDSLDYLPDHERELLERVENDPDIPVGAPLFLEGLANHTLTIETRTPSPSLLSPKSPRRSAPGTKSPVLLSPGREHTMEALIAMKRGKPSFLAPGEKAPEIDDEDAHVDKRKQQAKPITHDSGFKDLRDELEMKKKTDLDDLDKYRPSNFYKDDIDFQRPGYDIDDSPWDSHYQIGPDTYLMASQGAGFNSRVRDYRRNLWGDGAPLVRQGILGYRNQDISVRERRRYTDIMRESQENLKPKTTDGSLMRAPSASAVDRIKADIQNIAPSATKRNADGTYAPIFVSRIRDAYLGASSAAFECSVAGSPTPKVQWSLQGKPIEGDERRTIEQRGSLCRLTIHSPVAYDLGEYMCTAINEFGTDKTTSRLVSGEAPSRPGRPECQLSSDTELFITWEPPEGPTYLEGITYRLEYRPSGPTQLSEPWVLISDHVDDESVVVKHLEPLGIYQFRVTARNGVGLGVPSLSSRMVQTHGRGATKLHLDLLKSEYRLNVVTLPQRSARQLNEISEESESEHCDLAQTPAFVELSTKSPSERFQIDALLCKGRFSVLRQAVDDKCEGSAQCVVKIRDRNDDTAAREFKMLRDGQHENVQRLVAAHDSDGFVYLFCERLYEDVFSRFSFNDYYTEEQVALTMRQLTSAVHWLHFRGIAHLDVNPYNVMFQTKRNWIVKLVDFHSAQEVSSAIKSPEVNVLWAAPEQHVLDVPVTVQSDVWGMAVITFCLLGGFHPFTSEYDRPEEVKENVLNVKCDPNLIPVTASQEALSFVTWGLKKSPIRRMRTDEALSHKFLSADPSMVRRREAAKYSASRLRKTIQQTLPQPSRPISDSLQNKYGEKAIQ